MPVGSSNHRRQRAESGAVTGRLLLLFLLLNGQVLVAGQRAPDGGELGGFPEGGTIGAADPLTTGGVPEGGTIGAADPLTPGVAADDMNVVAPFFPGVAADDTGGVINPLPLCLPPADTTGVSPDVSLVVPEEGTVSARELMPLERGHVLWSAVEKAHSEPHSGQEESSASLSGLNGDGTQIDDVALKMPGGREAKRTDGHVFPAHRRIKRDVNVVMFTCPVERCELNNCYVASPVSYSMNRWWWETYDKSWVEVKQFTPRLMKVTFSPGTPITRSLKLWCFTGQQLMTNPDSTRWRSNYKYKLEESKKSKLVQQKHSEKDDMPVNAFSIGSNTTSDSKPGVQQQQVQNKMRRDTSQPAASKVNSALGLMVDYARERNFSNCWLCQNMPTSIHSPMFSPIPFSKADYMIHNWNDLGIRFKKEVDACYTPTFPVNSVRSTHNAGIALFVAETVNDKHLPDGFNRTMLVRIVHIQMYVKVGFEYRVQIVLAQTNCSEAHQNQICVLQPYTSTMMVEALVYVQPWFGTKSVGLVKIQVRNCAAAQQSEQAPLRDCSAYLPPVSTHELTNVPLCFRGVGKGQEDLGQSSCNTVINVTLKQSPLPERVYAVCGDKAYRCLPYEESHGVCYLAYLIPLIRKVEPAEVASLYPPLHRGKREISPAQKVTSVLLPWYGMYITQQELTSLSKVLESHLNASSRALLAEHKELQEVKTVALQNRMALDLLLAAQGGTCALVGTECCSYVSDATGDVMDMIHDTVQGIKELHVEHGFDLGDFSSVFGSWGSGLVRFLITLVVVVLLLIVLCTCMTMLIKLVIQKATRSVVQAPQMQVTVGANANDVGVRYYDHEGFEEWIQRLGLDDISLEDEEEETSDL